MPSVLNLVGAPAALREYEHFYNEHRPHQGVANARAPRPLPTPLTRPDHIVQFDAAWTAAARSAGQCRRSSLICWFSGAGGVGLLLLCLVLLLRQSGIGLRGRCSGIGPIRATGSGVSAVARTTAARWLRSGSWHRPGRQQG